MAETEPKIWATREAREHPGFEVLLAKIEAEYKELRAAAVRQSGPPPREPIIEGGARCRP